MSGGVPRVLVVLGVFDEFAEELRHHVREVVFDAVEPAQLDEAEIVALFQLADGAADARGVVFERRTDGMGADQGDDVGDEIGVFGAGLFERGVELEGGDGCTTM